MLKTFSAIALVTMAGAAFSQSTPSVTPSETPSVTPSQTPSVTPSQTPSVTPSQTPSVAPSGTPSVTPSPPAPIVTQSPSVNPSAVGGLSKCENMLGTEKDKCQQDERAGVGSTAPLR